MYQVSITLGWSRQLIKHHLASRALSEDGAKVWCVLQESEGFSGKGRSQWGGAAALSTALWLPIWRPAFLSTQVRGKMSSAASFLPKHSQYNMTQFSTTDRSPGPKPRAESRQSAGDDHNILEQPMAGAELCVNLGSPAWVTAGRKGGRTHRHSIFLHLASWPSLVPGKLNPACSYCCKWGTLCSLWAHCMGFQIKLSLNLQNEYRKDPLSSHLSRKLFMCFAVVFLLNTMHHQTVSVPGSFFFLKENAQFEFSVRPDLL